MWISAVPGEWEKGVWSESGKALVDGAVQESGHGRSTAQSGHWTVQVWLLLFLNLSLLLLSLLSSFILSWINMLLLFIYINIHINKYGTLHLVFFVLFFPSRWLFLLYLFLFSSLIIFSLILTISLNDSRGTQAAYDTLTHASVSSPVTVTPLLHPHSLDSCAAKSFSHHDGVQWSQLP